MSTRVQRKLYNIFLTSIGHRYIESINIQICIQLFDLLTEIKMNHIRNNCLRPFIIIRLYGVSGYRQHYVPLVQLRS